MTGSARRAGARVRRVLGRIRRRLSPPRPEPAPPWYLGDRIAAADRLRLVAAGVPEDLVANADLRLVEGIWPEGWRSARNRVLVPASSPVPAHLFDQFVRDAPTDALICLCSPLEDLAYFFVRGESPTVFVGPGCSLPDAELHCSASTLVLSHTVTATWHPTVDARNGGAIVVGRDQLWAAYVIVTTDDMHRLEDAATGARLNPFGGRIALGDHVWLGRDALIMGGTTIGRDCVVSTRATLRRVSIPDASVAAGSPARVVRSGVTWRRDDLP